MKFIWSWSYTTSNPKYIILGIFYAINFLFEMGPLHIIEVGPESLIQ